MISIVWYRILVPIDFCNKVIQASDAILDMKVANIENLLVHNANFFGKMLGELELLDALAEYRLESIFPNLSVSLRMFHTAPVTVASAERSFRKPKLIIDNPRSTMDQNRLSNLDRLSIESDIAKK